MSFFGLSLSEPMMNQEIEEVEQIEAQNESNVNDGLGASEAEIARDNIHLIPVDDEEHSDNGVLNPADPELELDPMENEGKMSTKYWILGLTLYPDPVKSNTAMIQQFQVRMELMIPFLAKLMISIVKSEETLPNRKISWIQIRVLKKVMVLILMLIPNLLKLRIRVKWKKSVSKLKQ